MPSFNILDHAAVPLPAVKQETVSDLFLLVPEQASGDLSVVVYNGEKPLPARYLAAVTKASRRWVLMVATYRVLVVNDTPKLGMTIISHHDVIELDGYHLSFVDDIISHVITENDLVMENRNQRCLHSRKQFAVGDRVTFCPVCDTAYLAEVWEEKGYCANGSCRYAIHRCET